MKKITGIDLSNYIVGYALGKGKPVSNLQLQKILYFVNGEFYRKYKRFLLDEDFYAYPLGPVNLEAYHLFKSYGASKIGLYDEVNLKLKPDEQETVDEVTDKYIQYSAYDLVELSHMVGKAWDKTRNEKGFYKKIDMRKA